MNIHEMDIVKILARTPYVNQRKLSEQSGYSLGAINRSLKALAAQGYLDEKMELTAGARNLLQESAPRRAIILAAGFGMRMVPINTEIPKALLKIKGESLIERLIGQLQSVGIREIYVVVGFMKEQFEYLIDDYGVELVVNSDYASVNNLHSLKLVADKLPNAYIVPCDIWCRNNPFSAQELYSWYMVSDADNSGSEVRVNRKMELVRTAEQGNAMIGISYITAQDAPALQENIETFSADPAYSQSFWETALYEKDKMTVLAKVVRDSDVFEVNTYEQLRDLDGESEHLRNRAITTVCHALCVDAKQVTDITVLKKGMTNRSFLFNCQGCKYIMRIPGEGTDQLIDRREEASVYQLIRDKNLCDDIVYIDPNNGYKITRYLENARVCDPLDENDLQRCMAFLRDFHDRGLQVEHEFDIFGKMDFYETLWDGAPSAYRDYQKTKEKVYSLRAYIDAHVERKTLTHIDAVPDNFLFYKNEKGQEELRLIDWEYAAMQDPYVDIAMFSIYALYNKEQIDHLIDIYFENHCPEEDRIKIYCYVAACGLLWSNWCEYKRNLGVEFGEYSLQQYRYAKDFYRYAAEAMKNQEMGEN